MFHILKILRNRFITEISIYFTLIWTTSKANTKENTTKQTSWSTGELLKRSLQGFKVQKYASDRRIDAVLKLDRWFAIHTIHSLLIKCSMTLLVDLQQCYPPYSSRIYWFGCRLDFKSVLSFWGCSSCNHVGFKPSRFCGFLPHPKTSQGVNSQSKIDLWLTCVLSGVIVSPLPQCSCDWPWIYHNPDQDKWLVKWN